MRDPVVEDHVEEPTDRTDDETKGGEKSPIATGKEQRSVKGIKSGQVLDQQGRLEDTCQDNAGEDDRPHKEETHSMAVLKGRPPEKDECGQGKGDQRLGKAIDGRLPERPPIVLHSLGARKLAVHYDDRLGRTKQFCCPSL